MLLLLVAPSAAHRRPLLWFGCPSQPHMDPCSLRVPKLFSTFFLVAMACSRLRMTSCASWDVIHSSACNASASGWSLSSTSDGGMTVLCCKKTPLRPSRHHPDCKSWVDVCPHIKVAAYRLERGLRWSHRCDIVLHPSYLVQYPFLYLLRKRINDIIHID